MITSSENHQNTQPPSQWQSKHFLFSVLWLGIASVLSIQYGLQFFIRFPFYLLFSTIVIIWLLVGAVFFGFTFARWRFKEIGLSIIVGLILIPPATYLHISYLDDSAEKALQSFIVYTRNDDIPDIYIVSDAEGLQCFSEDLTPTYQLTGDFFFGVYDWWIELDDGNEYYITTTRESLTLWNVNVSCPYGRNYE